MNDPIRRAHEQIRRLGLGGAHRRDQLQRRRPRVSVQCHDEHDRGLRLPDGSRTCFWCAVADRLGIQP